MIDSNLVEQEDIDWKIGDRFRRYDRSGTILDLFNGTVKQNYWAKVLYDKTEYDESAFVSIEHLNSLKKIKFVIEI